MSHISKDVLEMSFDLNTISHLGSQLYQGVPPAIAELLSNSYDAEASEVRIVINRDENQISVIDDGHGMTFEELNNSYLVVGRNRRKGNSGDSKNKKRKVTGRKGLGKLAIFGIANEIVVTTVCDGLKNSFVMNHKDIMSIDDSNDIKRMNTYNPKIVIYNEKTTESNGTTVEIRDILLSNITSANVLAHSLSSRFNFYDSTFSTIIEDESFDPSNIKISNELHIENIEKELELEFPADFPTDEDKPGYSPSFQRLSEQNVFGRIISSKKPLKKIDQGFVIYSRNKLTQERGFFNERSNDHFYNYATGYFHVDFIDDGSSDYISTGRTSIFWEKNKELQQLKLDLDKVIRYTEHRWRETREQNRKTELTTKLGNEFWEDLDPYEESVLKKIQTSISKDVTAAHSSDVLIDLMQTIKTQVRYESFKEYINTIDEKDLSIEELLKVSNDWELIETKELAKIALGRISTIDKLRNFVTTNASETKTIQPFFELFPWILDPKMTIFKREVTYKKLLLDKFPNEQLDQSNKRIDFLCSSANGVVHIIELKRPNVKITKKELEQAREYRAFFSHIHPEVRELKTFLISNRIDMDYSALDLSKSLKKDDFPIFVKSYDELIADSRQYHEEFIQLLEQLEESRAENK